MIDILTEWRKAHPDATKGIFLAEEDQQIIGTIFIKLPDDPRLSWWQQWKIVQPLGFWSALRVWVFLARSVSTPASHEAYGSGIAINPAYRRRRIAADLTNIAEDYARSQGKHIIYCYLAPDNTASINLLIQLGYRLNPSRLWIARLLRPKARFLRYEKQLG